MRRPCDSRQRRGSLARTRGGESGRPQRATHHWQGRARSTSGVQQGARSRGRSPRPNPARRSSDGPRTPGSVPAKTLTGPAPWDTHATSKPSAVCVAVASVKGILSVRDAAVGAAAARVPGVATIRVAKSAVRREQWSWRVASASAHSTFSQIRRMRVGNAVEDDGQLYGSTDRGACDRRRCRSPTTPRSSR